MKGCEAGDSKLAREDLLPYFLRRKKLIVGYNHTVCTFVVKYSLAFYCFALSGTELFYIIEIFVN